MLTNRTTWLINHFISHSLSATERYSKMLCMQVDEIRFSPASSYQRSFSSSNLELKCKSGGSTGGRKDHLTWSESCYLSISTVKDVSQWPFPPWKCAHVAVVMVPEWWGKLVRFEWQWGGAIRDLQHCWERRFWEMLLKLEAADLLAEKWNYANVATSCIIQHTLTHCKVTTCSCQPWPCTDGTDKRRGRDRWGCVYSPETPYYHLKKIDSA